MSTSASRRVLVVGHRAFAAKGLEAHLRAGGHEVFNFSRGKLGREGNTISGPIEKMHANEYLLALGVDTVINYVLLADDPIEKNNEFLAGLMSFCERVKVSHLIHVSSVSVYASSLSHVTESARVETDPRQKGSYGGLKVATDAFVSQNVPKGVKLTMYRPGFILAPGLKVPIIGMGFRMPDNRVLLLGNKNNRVCVVSRDIVHKSMARTVDCPPEGDNQVVLVVHPNPPTRKEYLEACCTLLGVGTKVVSFPVPLWLTAAAGGNVVAKLIGMNVKVWTLISAACRRQTFDCTTSAKRLGMSFESDWRQDLVSSMDGQAMQVRVPHQPVEPEVTRAKRVTFIGFGGIVKQKHLPALKKLGFGGQIDAYDLKAAQDPSGHQVKAIEGATLQPSDLYVVTSPGRVHNKSIPMLASVPGPVLIEKPLCYTNRELDEWLAFDESRGGNSVFVLQNSRFKPNVMAMLAHVQRYHPGALKQVDVHYQSPPVAMHSPAWRRDERGSQTLLLDYSLHYLDVAMMFTKKAWQLQDLRHELNFRQETALIEGRMRSEDYPVNFLLRQGFIPRRARIFFTFENYACSLGFFPDTFVAHMTGDGGALYKQEAKASNRATFRKILDKLTKQESDDSHALAMMAAMGDSRLGGSLALRNLEQVYRVLFAIGEKVYGPQD